MAHSLSSKKRMRQNEKHRQINRARRSAVKTAVRKFTEAAQSGSKDSAEQAFRQAARRLDQTAAKGTVHRNAAARRKSRLAKRLNALKARSGTS
jgi:small subunit ribosomal protein S20